MRTGTAVELACPLCRSTLEGDGNRWECVGCGRRFPVVAGIPDLRVEADPWIGIPEDREKARRLEEAVRDLDFPAAVRRYWEMTPSTPTDQAERFVRHVLQAEDRSREWLDRTGIAATVRTGERWLDVGAGTGDLATAAPDGVTVVGLDVALRWLVIARRRLRERGSESEGALMCANAEHLPFPDGAFARVLSLGTLAHCRDAKAVLRESRRVLAPGGEIRLRTVNRFSLLPEPHVGLFGVGWLPRRWADRYVRLRTGRPYVHHRPLGSRKLRSTMKEAGFSGVWVQAASALQTEIGRLGPWGRRVAPHYDRLRSRPVFAAVTRWLAPLLEAGGRAP